MDVSKTMMLITALENNLDLDETLESIQSDNFEHACDTRFSYISNHQFYYMFPINCKYHNEDVYIDVIDTDFSTVELEKDFTQGLVDFIANHIETNVDFDTTFEVLREHILINQGV